jgi:hypothetical protein
MTNDFEVVTDGVNNICGVVAWMIVCSKPWWAIAFHTVEFESGFMKASYRRLV